MNSPDTCQQLSTGEVNYVSQLCVYTRACVRVRVCVCLLRDAPLLLYDTCCCCCCDACNCCYWCYYLCCYYRSLLLPAASASCACKLRMCVCACVRVCVLLRSFCHSILLLLLLRCYCCWCRLSVLLLIVQYRDPLSAGAAATSTIYLLPPFLYPLLRVLKLAFYPSVTMIRSKLYPLRPCIYMRTPVDLFCRAKRTAVQR